VPELPPREDLAETMWVIFLYYCNFGQSGTHETMSVRNFLKLVRDCNIRDSRLTSSTVDVVLAKYGTRGFDIRPSWRLWWWLCC
jgi:hypothetical protein